MIFALNIFFANILHLISSFLLCLVILSLKFLKLCNTWSVVTLDFLCSMNILVWCYMATISARNSNPPYHEKMKRKHIKMKRRKKCRLTCTKELYTLQNWHRAGSVTPKAATFSCNERSRRGLSTCNRQNGGQAIPVPYRLHTYKGPGLL